MCDYAILRLYADDVTSALGAEEISLSPDQLSRVAEKFWDAVWENDGWEILRQVAEVVLERKGGGQCGN